MGQFTYLIAHSYHKYKIRLNKKANMKTLIVWLYFIFRDFKPIYVHLLNYYTYPHHTAKVYVVSANQISNAYAINLGLHLKYPLPNKQKNKTTYLNLLINGGFKHEIST